MFAKHEPSDNISDLTLSDRPTIFIYSKIMLCRFLPAVFLTACGRLVTRRRRRHAVTPTYHGRGEGEVVYDGGAGVARRRLRSLKPLQRLVHPDHRVVVVLGVVRDAAQLEAVVRCKHDTLADVNRNTANFRGAITLLLFSFMFRKQANRPPYPTTLCKI